MLERGVLQTVDAAGVDQFLDQPGLRVLFFAGSGNRHGDSHDVAVALREVLKEYGNGLGAALVDRDDEALLQPRFRVLKIPSLVLCVGGEAMEVIPGVRDWGDYIRSFRGYLGESGAAMPVQSTQE